MNIIVNSLQKNGHLFKTLEEVTPKELGIRNKIVIYSAFDIRKKSYAVLHVTQKSRILQANVSVFEDIVRKLSKYIGTPIEFKIIKIDSPLCSKAKAVLEKNGWKLI